MVFVPGGRLVEDLRLREADLEAEKLGSIGEAGINTLQRSFCVGNQGSIICEEKVSDKSLISLGVSLKAASLRLNRLPSRRYLTYTPSSSTRSSFTCISIMLKKMLKRVGARTQPCFTPLEMRKSSNRSPSSLIWPSWPSCS